MKNKELKTLKDLEEESVKDYGFDVATLRHLSWTLKAEAVKWVKMMKLIELREDTTESHSNRDCAYWIKYFFNLTEEDLKNE